MPSPSLDQIERWMLEVVTHPEGVEAGMATPAAQQQIPLALEKLDQLVAPSKSLTSVERVRLYANMYFWRIIDILVAEYPTVLHVTGRERFRSLATDFIVRYPSTHYDLGQMSREFPRYLAEEAETLDHRGFLADVARIERSMEDVFDAPNTETLQIDDLLQIPPEQWGDARFELIPAFRLLELSYPANRYVQAVRDQEHMDLPALETTWLAIYRSPQYRMWRASLSREQFELLTALSQGLPLAEAMEACLARPGVEAEKLVPSLQAWFQEWTQDGLFAGVRL